MVLQEGEKLEKIIPGLIKRDFWWLHAGTVMGTRAEKGYNGEKYSMLDGAWRSDLMPGFQLVLLGGYPAVERDASV